MAALFKRKEKSAFQRRQLPDAQFSQIKDALRKKNKVKLQAERVVMEWYVKLILLSTFSLKNK